jgi:hypothetical protein
MASSSAAWLRPAGRTRAPRPAHVGIRAQACALEALDLERSGQGDTLANGVRRLTQLLPKELLVVDAWHVHMDVDAVEQRTGDALLVARHHRGRAGASLLWVLPVAAWAGLHGCSNLPGRDRFHIEALGDASGEKYAYAVQYRTLLFRMPNFPI